MPVSGLEYLGGSIRSPLPQFKELNGLGSKKISYLHKAGIETPLDLLLRIPRSYEDRRSARRFADLYKTEGKGTVYTQITVLRIEYFRARGKHTPRILVDDTSETAFLLCFGRPFLSQKLRAGSTWLLAGNFSLSKGRFQSSSFEVYPVFEAQRFFRIQAQYGQISGIFSSYLHSIYREILALSRGKIIDALPSNELKHARIPDIAWALWRIHLPENLEDIEPARRRLAYGEIRSIYREQQLISGKSPRSEMPRQNSEVSKRAHSTGASTFSVLQQKVVDSLAFSLSPDQIQAVHSINADLAQRSEMNRLLQGDVGSGKTLVALLASIGVVERGAQTALMVPTEILALQHRQKIEAILRNAGLYAELHNTSDVSDDSIEQGELGMEDRQAGVSLNLYCASMPVAEKRASLKAMKAGIPGIWVGTHSLFGEKVEFANLHLVIIDEQHRFGVNQREQLGSKLLLNRVLMLSATPIPRTLTLTLFGSMDVSTIRTMPAERKPIRTHLAAIGNEEKVYREVEKQLADGWQAYFVYPRIEQNEDNTEGLDLKSAESMYDLLKERFKNYKVGIVHSRRAVEERQESINAFARAEIDILVATTVIEVGVDVPSATVMVIEQAERFGLSALHQLRGRVGRGSAQSYCYLIFDPNLSDDARKRMRVLKEQSDGFALAEADLRIRGPGNIVGMEQSGYLNLDFASLYKDLDLIEKIVQWDS